MNYATPLLDLSNLFGLEEGKINLNINFEGKYGFMTARLGTRNLLPVFYFGLGLQRKCPFAKINFRANIFLILQIHHFRTELFFDLKIFFLHVVIRKIRLYNFQNTATSTFTVFNVTWNLKWIQMSACHIFVLYNDKREGPLDHQSDIDYVQNLVTVF
jgi:hypothetical protein